MRIERTLSSSKIRWLCLITENDTICEVEIPTYKIITQIATTYGFRVVEINRDEIKNRTLPPDRKHNGGVVKEEWITVFKKVAVS